MMKLARLGLAAAVAFALVAPIAVTQAQAPATTVQSGGTVVSQPGSTVTAAPGANVTAQPGAQITTAPGTSINVGANVTPWLQYFFAAMISAAMALLLLGCLWVRNWLGLKDDANAEKAQADFIRNMNAVAQVGAGYVVMKVGERLKDVNLEVGSPVIKEAIEQVNAQMLGTAKEKMSEKVIGEMIIAQVGVITAPSPDLAPTTGKPAPLTPGART